VVGLDDDVVVDDFVDECLSVVDYEWFLYCVV